MSGSSLPINLARELNADLSLIDETRGRNAAIALHIRTTRTAACFSTRQMLAQFPISKKHLMR